MTAGRTGRAVWIGLLVAGLSLLGLVASPALLAETPLAWVGDALREAYAPFCHQHAGRCFHLGGVPLAACSRCVGVMSGAVLGLLLSGLAGWIGRIRLWSPALLAAGLAPLALDATLGLLGLWHNTHGSRALTGLVAGVTGTIYLLPAATRAVLEIRERRERRRSLARGGIVGPTENIS